MIARRMTALLMIAPALLALLCAAGWRFDLRLARLRHAPSSRRPSPAVGPVPFAERIASVGAARVFSGGIAAFGTGSGVRRGERNRREDEGGEGERGNEGLHSVSPGAAVGRVGQLARRGCGLCSSPSCGTDW